MKASLKLSISFIVLLLVVGCVQIKTLRMIKSEKVKTSHFSFKEKDIIFVPLVHYGQKQFYESLKDSVILWKKNGYTVFYEQIKKDTLQDSTSQKMTLLKLRRVLGSVASRDSYTQELSEVFENAIAQPYYDFFTIDSTDLNVDVTYSEIIEETERLYGEIKLDECDYQTPIDSSYNCKTKWKSSMTDPIIIDYRNKNVAKTIEYSEKKKIVVLYGANHIKGIKQLLKERR